jgi:hypothetical protein
MKKSIFICFAFIWICSNAFGQNLSPKKGFYPIQNIQRKMAQLAKNKMLMQGQDMSMVTNMNMYSTVNIQGPVSDSQKITITFNKIDGDIEVMGKKQIIPDASKTFKPIVLTTNNQGVINSIIGSPELLKQMEQSYSGSFQLNKTFTQFLNIQSIKNIGDSWLDSNIDASNSMITQYTYDRNENGNAILSFNTSVIIKSVMNQNGIIIHNDLLGKMNGSMTVDTKSNYIISSIGNINLEGRMEMNTQEIPVNINSTFNDSVVK